MRRPTGQQLPNREDNQSTKISLYISLQAITHRRNLCQQLHSWTMPGKVFRGGVENSSVDIGLTAAACKNLSGKSPERGRMVLPFENISSIQIIFAS